MKIYNSLKSNKNYNGGIILLTNEDEKNIDLYASYFKNFNLKITNKLKTKNYEIDVFLKTGIVFYTFENAPEKSNAELIKNKKTFFINEYERAKGLLHNTQFLNKAESELINKEQEKMNFY